MPLPLPWAALAPLLITATATAAAGHNAQPRLDHAGPGLTAEECKLANKILFRVQVDPDTAEEAERIAQIAPPESWTQRSDRCRAFRRPLKKFLNRRTSSKN